MVRETRKMFHDDALQISATTIRVPVLRAHSEAINVEFAEPFPAAEAEAILAQAAGVRIVNDPAQNHFPMPIEASGCDEVLVGRIRQDISRPDGTGLDLWGQRRSVAQRRGPKRRANRRGAHRAQTTFASVKGAD